MNFASINANTDKIGEVLFINSADMVCLVVFCCCLVLVNVKFKFFFFSHFTDIQLPQCTVKQPWGIWVNNSHDSIQNFDKKKNIDKTKHNKNFSIFMGCQVPVPQTIFDWIRNSMKSVMLLFVTYSSTNIKILHMSQQCNCRDVCKILLWSVEHILNQSTPNFEFWIQSKYR